MANDTVSGSFTGTGQSATFTPQVGQRSTTPGQFNVFLETSDFIGTVQLERLRPGSSNWCKIGVWSGGSFVQLSKYVFAGTEGNTSEIIAETEQGVTYRLNCTARTSGTLTYSIEGTW